jgi:hypothetical protein
MAYSIIRRSSISVNRRSPMRSRACSRRSSSQFHQGGHSLLRFAVNAFSGLSEPSHWVKTKNDADFLLLQWVFPWDAFSCETLEVFNMDLGVNHGRAGVAVAQELLDMLEVRFSLKKMARAGASETMRIDWETDAGCSSAYSTIRPHLQVDHGHKQRHRMRWPRRPEAGRDPIP